MSAGVMSNSDVGSFGFEAQIWDCAEKRSREPTFGIEVPIEARFGLALPEPGRGLREGQLQDVLRNRWPVGGDCEAGALLFLGHRMSLGQGATRSAVSVYAASSGHAF